MTEIVIAELPIHFERMAHLAHVIWHEHYTPIIGQAQVEYMVNKFQTAEAMKHQVENGFEYYIINFNQETIGYLSIKHNDDDLFLSKIYIRSDHRGLKIGKTAMLFVEKRAQDLSCKSVSLTVNKYNTNSIKAYEKVGFVNMGAVQKDIGNGFIMDDYAMKKTIEIPD